MEAKLEFPNGEVVILDDDLTWRAPEEIEWLLNRLFGADLYGPGHGEPGWQQARDAARELGAELTLAPRSTYDPGVDY